MHPLIKSQGHSPVGLERCSHIAEVPGSSPGVPTKAKNPVTMVTGFFSLAKSSLLDDNLAAAMDENTLLGMLAVYALTLQVVIDVGSGSRHPVDF